MRRATRGCSGGAGCTAPRFRSAGSVSLGPGLYYLFVDGYGTDVGCSCGDYAFAITGM